MPDNFFPFAVNARTCEDGVIGPRPPLADPYATNLGGGTAVLSLHRMQDSTPNGPATGYVYISTSPIGGIYVVNPSEVNPLPSLTGFSGKRVSIVPYRPGSSVQPWAYIGDTLRMGKVNSLKVGYRMGIAEPQVGAVAIIGGVQYQSLAGFNGIPPWVPFGTGGAISSGNVGTTVLATLYDSGASGEATLVLNIGTTIVPNSVWYANANPALPLFLEAFIAAPSNTNIGTIVYDSGTTGLATIVTTTLPATIQVGSVYSLGGAEFVKVLSVVKGVSSATVRVSTQFTHVAAEAMTGNPSLRASIPFGGTVVTVSQFSLSNTIGAGAGGIQEQASINTATLSTILGSRQVQATDLLHFVVNVIGAAANITNCVITFNLDPNVIDFTTNAFQWTIAGGTFSNTVVTDASIAVSALVRLGTNTALSLQTGVNAIKIVFTVTAPVTPSYIGLTLVGTYGPTGTGANSPVLYRYIYRSAEGAKSNPSPAMRFGVQPVAQSVQLQAAPSPDPQVKFIDWYRGGGSFTQVNGVEEDHYVGTVPNTVPPAPPITFTDALDDITASINPLLEFDNYEPFPSIDLPASGVVNVNQYGVTLVSGTAFNLRWAPGTLINIGGTVYTLYNRPTSASALTIFQNGGTQLNVPYSITAPVLLAQPLPALWGPTDNAGFLFGAGDPLRPGALYFTKGNNADSAPQTNSLEATGPDEPLMNGAIIDGLCMVFSTERAWWAYPNFSNITATLVGTVGTPFYLVPAISKRGLFARFGICTDGGGTVYFISKDGIYKSRGAEATCITDLIYSLFPHESSAQSPIPIPAFALSTPGYAVNPPDYTNPGGMSLSFAEDRLYFDYRDLAGAYWSLVMDVRTGIWGVDSYPAQVTVHAASDGNAIGSAVGALDGSIRVFDGVNGTENISCLIQSTQLSTESPGWQHVKEFEVEYSTQTGPLGLQFMLNPDPEGIEPPLVPIPVAAIQTKQFETVGANKFKLAQYTIIGSKSQWRLWAGKFEMKVGSWERGDGYRTVNPFEAFAKVKQPGAGVGV